MKGPGRRQGGRDDKDTHEDVSPDQYEKRYAWCCRPHPNPTAKRPANAVIKMYGDDETKANRATSHKSGECPADTNKKVTG